MNTSLILIMRQLFYTLIMRPLLLILLGFNIRNLDRLTAPGAHLIAANHNSHLDAVVLMSLFKPKDIPRVKLVAAKDYWCRTPMLAWFSLNIIGIIPIDRNKESNADPIAPIIEALNQNYTVVIFPEGSRGDPERRQPLKFGIAKILEAKPDVLTTPIIMHGLGKSLPRGEGLLVPFVCEINIGENLRWEGERVKFMSALEKSFSDLENELEPKPWT